MAQPAAAEPEVSVPVPKPGAGEALDNCFWHSAGAVLKAEQIVLSRLALSRAESVIAPLITKVGEP